MKQNYTLGIPLEVDFSLLFTAAGEIITLFNSVVSVFE